MSDDITQGMQQTHKKHNSLGGGNLASKKRIVAGLLAMAIGFNFSPGGVVAAFADEAAYPGKTLTAAHEVGKVQHSGAASGTQLTGNQTSDRTNPIVWSGNQYVADGANVVISADTTTIASATDKVPTVKVTGNVTVWVGTGATLTINGPTGYNAADDRTQFDAIQGGAAIQIGSDGTLTFAGGGTVIVNGGTGGSGYDWSDQVTSADLQGMDSSYNNGRGGHGSQGGDAVENKGALTIAPDMLGKVTILGGTGGVGGKGRHGAPAIVRVASFTNQASGTEYHVDSVLAAQTGGYGGNGGLGGYGINNTSTAIVTFNQDSSNHNLSESTFTTGNVNVKGGQGGRAGDGGDASPAYVFNGGDYPGSTLQSYINRDQGTILYATFSNYMPTKAGNAGTSGSGGVGIIAGTVNFLSGVTGVEGGYGTIGASVGYYAAATLTLYNRHRYNAYQIVSNETSSWEETVISGNNNYYGPHAVSADPVFYMSSTGPTPGGPAYQSVTVKNGGGTSYAFGGLYGAAGNAGTDSSAVGAGTTFTTYGNGRTGSIYVGDAGSAATGYSGNLANSSVVTATLNNLEGTNYFGSSAKNFYVLNNGDWWYDADGTKHTSEGIKVGDTKLNAWDVYVNPQGMLYLDKTNLPNGSTISLDLAVNGTRNGKAGEVKEVRLTGEAAGVYRFEGTVTGGTARLYARYATDTEATNKTNATSYDSSFDMPWLFAQNFNNPITVNTAPQLAAVAWAVNNGVSGASSATYNLNVSLDLGNFHWTPIGTEEFPFKGIFNGNNKTIDNIWLDGAIEGVTDYGLFGKTVGATIKNLELSRYYTDRGYAETVKSNGHTTAATSGGNYGANYDRHVINVSIAEDVNAGALIGHAVNTNIDNVKVRNVDVTATSTNGNAAVGGVVGRATGPSDSPNNFTNLTVTKDTLDTSLNGSDALVDVSGSAKKHGYVGGAVGYIENVNVDTASLGIMRLSAGATEDGTWVGGAVGYATNADLNKIITMGSGGVSATSDKNAYASGIVGQLLTGTISNSATAYFTSYHAESTAQGNAYTGGAAGHASDVDVSGVAIGNAASYTAKAVTGDTFAAGVVGRADNTDITDSKIYNVTKIEATSTASGESYASGIAGYITGKLNGEKQSAEISGNEVNSGANSSANTASLNVSANATGAGKDAAAGGIVGFGLEVSSFDNKYLNGGSGSNTVKAIATEGEAFAGGLLGTVTNEGRDKIAVNDMTINNIAVTANGGGGEAYAGGVVGKAEALNGLEMISMVVNGKGAVANVTAEAQTNVYAGRLVGYANKATIVGASFDNHGYPVNVSAESTGTGDHNVYVGGAVGMIDKKGEVSASGVVSTNVTGKTASNDKGTIWAGGLIGYAQDTSIIDSSVNLYVNDVTGADVTNLVSSLTAETAAKVYAGGIAGEVVNTNLIDTDLASRYLISNALSVNMKLRDAAGTLAGGLYGKINDAIIGSSYARGYSMLTGANHVASTFTSGKFAGMVAELTNSELIAVYAVGSLVNGPTNNVIDSYPGYYHTGSNNQFHGSYAVHTYYQVSTTGSNVFGNSFYVDNSAPSRPFINEANLANIAKYYKSVDGGLKELQDADVKVLHYSEGTDAKPATALRAELFYGNDQNIKNLMDQYLHEYMNKGTIISTPHELRLGLGLEYAHKQGTDIGANYGYPYVRNPVGFSLMVSPSTNYGYIGEEYSTYHDLGTKMFSPGSQIKFEAKVVETLPQFPVFYEFIGWRITTFPNPKDGIIETHNGNGTKLAETISINASGVGNYGNVYPMNPKINLVVPEGITDELPVRSMSLTANFAARDNSIRAALNSAISESLNIAVDTIGDSKLQGLLEAGKKDEALALIYDAIILNPTLFTPILKEFSDQILEVSETNADNTSNFDSTYPEADKALYSLLVDKDAVAKQILMDALETVVNNDTFASVTGGIDITDIEKKIDYVDIGTTLFVKGNNFDKYVASQLAFETSGSIDGSNGYTQPGITGIGLAENGKDYLLDLSNLFDNTNVSNADTGKVYVSYINPHSPSVSALGVLDTSKVDGDIWDDRTNNSGNIWNEADRAADGSYSLTFDPSLLVNENGGKTYIYLMEVDSNGYSVVTRVEVGESRVTAENVALNKLDGGDTNDTANEAVGNDSDEETNGGGADKSDPLVTEDILYWYKTVELMKTDPDKNYGSVGGFTDQAGNEYYKNGLGGDLNPNTYITNSEDGAYAEGIYVVVDATNLSEEAKTKLKGLEEWGLGEKDANGLYESYEIPLTAEAAAELGTSLMTYNNGIVELNLTGNPENKFTAFVTQPGFTDEGADEINSNTEGAIIYMPNGAYDVKGKYVNPFGELNAADDATNREQGLKEVQRAIETEHYAEAMDIYPQVMDVYEERGEYTDTTYGGALSQDRVIELMLDLMPTTEGETAYPTTADANNMLTYLLALQELLEAVDTHKEDIALLSTADKDRIAQAAKRVEDLLNNKDYTKGGNAKLSDNDLQENFELLYETGFVLYNLLNGVILDTVTLTVKSNIMSYMLINQADDTREVPTLLGNVLYSMDGVVQDPTAIAVGTMAAGALLNNAAASVVLDSKAIVVVKDESATVIISGAVDTEGYDFAANVTRNGQEYNITRAHLGNNTSASAISLSKSGDYVINLPKLTSNTTLTVIFTAMKLDITIDGDTNILSSSPVDEIQETDSKGKTVAIKDDGALLPAYDNGDGDYVKDLTYGDSLTYTLVPEEDTVIPYGLEVVYTENGEEKRVPLNPDGTFTIPDIKGSIEILGVDDDGDSTNGFPEDCGFVDLSKKALEDLIDAIEDLDLDALGYTPETWKDLTEALEAAEEFLDGGTGNLKDLYDDLANAISDLTKQHKISMDNIVENLDGVDQDPFVNGEYYIPELKNKGTVSQNAYGEGYTVTALQNGVVKVVNNETGEAEYFVQDGYSVFIQPDDKVWVWETKDVNEISYTTKSGDTSTVPYSNVGSFTIPSVTEPVTQITVSTGEKSFDVTQGKITGPNGGITVPETGERYGTGKMDEVEQPVYSIPDMVVEDVEGDITGAIVLIKDEAENDHKIYVRITGDDGVEVVVDGVTLTTVPKELLESLIDGEGDEKDLTLTGDQIEAIIDAFNDTANTPKIIVGEHTEIELKAEVAGKLEKEYQTTEPQPMDETRPSLPAYVITPASEYHVEVVQVRSEEDAAKGSDGTFVALPSESIIEQVISNGKAGNPYTHADEREGGGMVYTELNPLTGATTTVEVDSKGNVVSVTVDPGVDAAFEVTFNTDLTDPDYGVATVVWKDEDESRHFVVGADIVKNEFPITLNQKNSHYGQVTAESSGNDAAGRITSGNDAIITLDPTEDGYVDLEARITINFPHVQAESGLNVTASIQDILDGKVKGVSAKEVVDGSNNPTGEIIITVADVTGPITITANNVFKAAEGAVDRTEKDEILDALQELIDMYNLGEKIEEEYGTPESPYNDQKGIDNLNNQTDNADDVVEAITKGIGTTDELRDSIEAAEGDKLLDLVKDLIIAELEQNGALPEDIAEIEDIGSLTDLLYFIEDLTDAIEEAIEALKTGDNKVVVLPGITKDPVDTDEGINHNTTLPTVKDGFVDGDTPLVIENVYPLPGNEVESVVITVLDPDTGKAYVVEIPVTNDGSIPNKGKLVVTEVDPETGEQVGSQFIITIPADDEGAKTTNPTEVTVPGKTIVDIVKAITGNDKPYGIVTDVAVETGGADTLKVPNALAGVDTGVDTDASKPLVNTIKDDGKGEGNYVPSDYIDDGKRPVGNGKVDLTGDKKEGIEVGPIYLEEDVELKGIEITVKDGDNYVSVFVPATEDNTGAEGLLTDDNDEHPFTVTITPEALEKAIQDALGKKDLTGVNVVDVDVVTGPQTISEDLLTDGAELDKGVDGTGEVTVEDVDGDENDDLVVSGVNPEPGFELDGGMTIEVTDPKTGTVYEVYIPNTDGGNINDKLVAEVIDPKTGEKTGETVDIPRDVIGGDKGASYNEGDGEISVPMDTIEDIIDFLTGVDTDGDGKPDISTGYVSDITIDSDRIGHALPENNEGTPGDGIKPGANITVDTQDNDNSDAIISGVDNALVISGIDPEEGFVVDSVELTITNPVTGKDIVVTIPVPADATDFAEGIEVTYTDDAGKEKTITVRPGLDADDKITLSGDTVTIPEDVLEDILAAVVDGVLLDEFGETAAKKYRERPIDTDITDVTVNAIPDGTTLINVPDTADAGKGVTDGGDVTVVDGGTEVPGLIVDDPGDIVIDNIDVNTGHTLTDVVLTVDIDGTEVVITIPVDGEGPATYTVDGGEPKELDAVIPADMVGDGTDSGEKITIPGDLVLELIDEVKDAENLDGPVEITDIEVNAERKTIGIPTAPGNDDKGITNGGDIKVDVYTEVEIDDNAATKLDDLDLSKGITITDIKDNGGKKDGVEDIIVTIDAGGKDLIITVEPNGDGDADVTVKYDGKDLKEAIKDALLADLGETPSPEAITAAEEKAKEIAENIINAIEKGLTEDSESYTLDLPGMLLDAIIDAVGAGNDEDPDLKSVVVNPDGERTVTGLVPDSLDPLTGQDTMTGKDDLIIDNIVTLPEYVVDHVKITVKDDNGDEHTIIVPVPLTAGDVFDDNAVITVIDPNSPNGVTTYSAIDVISDAGEVTLGTGTNPDSEKITIPGSVLEEIIKNIMRDTGGDIIAVEVGTTANAWILPPAIDVLNNNSDGLTNVTLNAKDKTSKSEAGDDINVVVTHKNNEALTVNLTYTKDDFQTKGALVYHTFDGLKLDGITLTVEELEEAGALASRSNTDPLTSLYKDKETLVIDMQALSDLLASKGGVLSNDALEKMEILTVPQNNQYKSFLDEFADLLDLFEEYNNDLPDTEPDRTIFEEGVAKLVEQFQGEGENPLSPDNKDHLLDKWIDLAKWQDLIDSQREAALSEQEIGDVYTDLENAIKDILAGDPEFDEYVAGGGSPIDYVLDEIENNDRTKEIVDEDGNVTEVPSTIWEDYPNLVVVIEDLKDEIMDAQDNFDKLNDYAEDHVGSDAKEKLEDMYELLEEANKSKFADEGEYLRDLLSQLPPMPDIVPETDSLRNDRADFSGDTLADKLDDLGVYERALERVQDAFDNADPDTKTGLPEMQSILDGLKEAVAGEWDDLAEIFAKEYLTDDKDFYDGEGENSKDNTNNGITVDTPDIRTIVTDALTKFNELPEEAQDAIDELFHHPTLRELYNEVFGIDSDDNDGKALGDILKALDTDDSSGTIDYLTVEDLTTDDTREIVEPSNKSVVDWAKKVIALEESVNALSPEDRAALDEELVNSGNHNTEPGEGNTYEELLGKAHEVIAKDFLGSNNLDDLDIDDLSNKDKANIIGSEEDWHKLTPEQQDLVNEELQDKYGLDYDGLLEKTKNKGPSEDDKDAARKEIEDHYQKLLDDPAKQYSEEQEARLTAERDNALTAIDNAQTENALKKAVTDGKDAMDKVPYTKGENPDAEDDSKTDEYNIVGYVVDEDGNPVPNAEVKVTVRQEVTNVDDKITYTYTTLRTTTDENGRYVLPINNLATGDYFIYVEDKDTSDEDDGTAVAKRFLSGKVVQGGHVLETIVLDGNADEAVIGGSISEFGSEAAGGSITNVVNKDTGESVSFTPAGLTAGGGYVVDGLVEDGTYIITYENNNKGTSGQVEIVVKDGYAYPNADKESKAPVNVANIGSGKGEVVSGMIDGLTPGGTATVTIAVPVYNEKDEVTGTKTVTFTAEDLDGDGEAYYQFAGVPAGDYVVTVTDNETGESVLREVTVGAGSNKPNQDISFGDVDEDHSKAITGIVMDEKGKPIEGATVTLYDENGNKVDLGPDSYVVTGEGGGYSILIPDDLPKGNYYISADTHDGGAGNFNGLTGPVEIKDGKLVGSKGNVTVDKSGDNTYLLIGTATDSNGKPLSKQNIAVTDDGDSIANATTNKNGNYIVGGVPEGADVSTATKSGEYVLKDVGSVTSDGTLDGDLQTAKPDGSYLVVIGPNGELLGMKTGEQNTGSPDKKATVKVYTKNPDGTKGEAVTPVITDGKIEVTGLPASDYIVVLEQDGMLVEQPITVVKDKNNASVISGKTIVGINTTIVSGTLTYKDTKVNPSDATVTIIGDDSRVWGTSAVDPNTGAFSIGNIPPGSYDVEIKLGDTAEDGTDMSVTIIAKLVVDANGIKEFITTGGTEISPMKGKGSAKIVIPTSATDSTTFPDNSADYFVNQLLPNADTLPELIAASEYYGKLTQEQKLQIKDSVVEGLSTALNAAIAESKLNVVTEVKNVNNAVTPAAQTTIEKGLESMKGLTLTAKDIPVATIETRAGGVTTVIEQESDVKLTLSAESGSKAKHLPDQEKVEVLAESIEGGGVGVAIYYDFEVEKQVTITTTTSNVDGETKTEIGKNVNKQGAVKVNRTPKAVKFTLEIPKEHHGYKYYAVVRVHEGETKILPYKVSKNKTSIDFSSNLFSTYAILYSDTPISRYDLLASMIDDYDYKQQIIITDTGAGEEADTITIGDFDGGTATVNDPKAKEGDTVTITVTPDPGFKVSELTITASDGTEISYVDNGDGTYTFIMPDGGVVINAVFAASGVDTGVSRYLITNDHIAFVQGDNLGNFNPNAPVTRAEIAQIFYNLLSSKAAGDVETNFADVAEDAWYTTAVNTLASLGFVRGYDGVSFGPGDNIRRGDFMRLATGFAYEVEGTNNFFDVADDYYAVGNINTAVSYGWINGYEDGSFKPTDHITRAEAVKVINAMLNRRPDKNFIMWADGIRRFPDVAESHWAYYQIIEASTAHDHEFEEAFEKWLEVRK